MSTAAQARDPRLPPGVTIREATAADAEEVGRLLAAGLADKYGPAYGGKSVEAITAIARAAADPAREGSYLVAICDEVCAGVAYLGTDGQGAPVIRPLISALGPLRAARATLVLAAFAKGVPARDEATLDELAVADDFRRRGIGTALIEECARRAGEAGRSRLGLWVTGDNIGAQALYLTAGFEVVRRRRWPTGRLLFGARGALKMELALDRGVRDGAANGAGRPARQ